MVPVSAARRQPEGGVVLLASHQVATGEITKGWQGLEGRPDTTPRGLEQGFPDSQARHSKPLPPPPGLIGTCSSPLQDPPSFLVPQDLYSVSRLCDQGR